MNRERSTQSPECRDPARTQLVLRSRSGGRDLGTHQNAAAARGSITFFVRGRERSSFNVARVSSPLSSRACPLAPRQLLGSENLRRMDPYTRSHCSDEMNAGSIATARNLSSLQVHLLSVSSIWMYLQSRRAPRGEAEGQPGSRARMTRSRGKVHTSRSRKPTSPRTC